MDNIYIDKRMQRLLQIVIFALILTTAKGLRIGSNMGLGELILLGFSLISIIKCIKTGVKTNWRLFYTNNLFWLIIFFTLFLGMFIRMNFSPIGFIFPRTLLAYSFVFIVITSIFISNILEYYPIIAVKDYVRITAVIAFFCVILIFADIKSIIGINLYWLGSHRFQGWSLDPNQFTLPFIIAPFAIGYLYKYKENEYGINKFTALFYLLFIVFVGIKTSSDTLLMSWGAGGIILLTFLLFAKGSKKTNPLIKIMTRITIIGVIIVLFLSNIQFIQSTVEDIFYKDNQGLKRIQVWKESIDVIKLSPLVGLGPDMGRYEINTNGTMGEAHNNILQLGMSSGILGILALLSYFGLIFIHTVKSKDPFIIAAFIALFCFGITHYTLRHPIYWFMLLLVDSLAIKDNYYKNEVNGHLGVETCQER